jgi:hypothetical protein
MPDHISIEIVLSISHLSLCYTWQVVLDGDMERLPFVLQFTTLYQTSRNQDISSRGLLTTRYLQPPIKESILLARFSSSHLFDLTMTNDSLINMQLFQDHFTSMFALFLALSQSNPKPSGQLWTPKTPFNISTFRSIVKNTEFRVLQLTDLHINVPEVCILNALAVIETLIDSVKPDLIIMTGDTVAGNMNGVSADILIDFLDEFKVPYTFALGNHDGEGGHDNEDLTHLYAGGIYSFFDRGPGSIHGFSNSAVNLVNSTGNVIYSLITIDSNRYRDFADNSSGYDYIYPDQGMWLEWFTKGINAQQGKTVKNMLFYHIPLPEMSDVKADMEKVDPTGAAFAFRMGPSPSHENSEFWRKVKDLGATTHMYFGHDHRNLVNYNWQGVNWVYGLKTGLCSYWDADRIGGTLITIGQDGQVAVDFIYETDIPKLDHVRQFLTKENRRVRMREMRSLRTE